MARGRRKLDAADWDEKIHRLRKTYPEINGIDWSKILLEHPNVFSTVASGVAKTATNKNGKNGVPKEKKISSIYEEPNSNSSFMNSLNELWGDRTVAEMAKLTGVSAAVIRKLKLGEREPLFDEMEKIAKAFDIDPGYFVEYRVATILSAIDNYLATSPEVTASWYKKVKGRKGLKIK